MTTHTLSRTQTMYNQCQSFYVEILKQCIILFKRNLKQYIVMTDDFAVKGAIFCNHVSHDPLLSNFYCPKRKIFILLPSRDLTLLYLPVLMLKLLNLRRNVKVLWFACSFIVYPFLGQCLDCFYDAICHPLVRCCHGGRWWLFL